MADLIRNPTRHPIGQHPATSLLRRVRDATSDLASPELVGMVPPRSVTGLTAPSPREITDRVSVDGRQLHAGGQRFAMHGTSYGTFAPRAADGAPLPETPRLRSDLAAMAAAGLNTLRVYTPPTDDLLDAAGERGLRVLAGLFHEDWRDVVGAGRRQRARLERDTERELRRHVGRLAGDPRVLAVCLANEIPADVVRWVGEPHVRSHLRRLATAEREEDPGALVTYANYPSTEYLAPDLLDVVTFNVFLNTAHDLRRYLGRLMNQAGDRPVLLGELGRHTAGGTTDDASQARWLDAQLRVARECGVAGTCVFSWTDEWVVGGRPVEGWQFGLVRADRTPRPALDVVQRWSTASMADLRRSWPSISVVVCAHNEERTISECLDHTMALDYPRLEVIVVDDGSTDRTREIADASGAIVIGTDHGGLSAARNRGWQHATGELIAFLDADAYPTPDWPYHLAMAFEGPRVGAVGGPNIGPPTDGPTARCVAAAPGGPNHVLLDDTTAEHVPGCNLAVRRSVLLEVGGFDPIFRTAGDDVDLCWRVLDRHHRIGFSPAALVWHHRRATVRAYLRQQRGYGRAERLVEARHPDRCTVGGRIRWHGRIYSPLPRLATPGRIYRGALGTAPFQSVYASDASWDDVAHQIGTPVALMVAAVSVVLAGWWTPLAAIGAAAAITGLLGMIVVDTLRARRSSLVPRGLRHALVIAVLGVLQPLARWWGRNRRSSRTHFAPASPCAPLVRFEPTTAVAADQVVLVADRPRAEVTAAVIEHLRLQGVRVQGVAGWEDHDGAVATGMLCTAQLQTSGHPAGLVHARIRVRPRRRAFGAVVLGAATVRWAGPEMQLALAALVGGDLLRSLWRVTSARRHLRAVGR